MLSKTCAPFTTLRRTSRPKPDLVTNLLSRLLKVCGSSACATAGIMVATDDTLRKNLLVLLVNWYPTHVWRRSKKMSRSLLTMVLENPDIRIVDNFQLVLQLKYLLQLPAVRLKFRGNAIKNFGSKFLIISLKQ